MYGFKMKLDLANKIQQHECGQREGTRPRVVRQQQIYINAYLWCCLPINRTNRSINQPILSMEMMEKHLKQISDATPAGRYAIVIMDCASWHSSKLVSGFKNLSIMHLPPYSPELNPIEQVWAWLRSNDLEQTSHLKIMTIS